MPHSPRLAALATTTFLLLGGAAMAGEHPIGDPIEKNGLQVTPVYLQAVAMAPSHGHHDADIHLEADIKAMASNPQGFREDSWVPYLNVAFEVSKDGKVVASGPLVPMVANDGPHYGANVKMAGAGKYNVTVRVAPPDNHFYRHIDKETGVGKWWEPFEAKWDFTYVGGAGKKGGY